MVPISDPVLWWICGLMGLVYLLTAIAVVMDRLGYERRQRVLSTLEGIVVDVPRDGTPASPDVVQRGLEHLSRSSTDLVLRITGELLPSAPALRLLTRSVTSRLGQRVLEAQATHGRDAWRRVAALRVLALAGNGHTPWDILERALRDPVPDVRAAIVVLLGQIADRRAAGLLVDALVAESVPRSRVATSLQAFPVDVPEIVEPLIDSPQAPLRYWAAHLMRRYPHVPHFGVKLTQLAKDSDPAVRRAALETIGSTNCQSAVDVARSGLDDPVPYVRAHAARALAALSTDVAIPGIAELLADREWWVRLAAKESLEAMGDKVTLVLLQMLSHSDGFARNGAAEVLQNLGAFERLLARYADTPTLLEGNSACDLLLDAGGPRMWETVVNRLNDPGHVRALQALASAHVRVAG